MWHHSIVRSGSRRRILCAFVAALAACSDPVSLVYVDRRPFTPPLEIYTTWWAELEACLDRTRDFDGIRWFLADEIGQAAGPVSGSIRGQWLSNREITIKSGHEHVMVVVKHEMMHDLLRGDGGHRHELWGYCEQRGGMPAEPIIPTGTYDVEIHFTVIEAGVQEWRYSGTLDVVSVTEDRLTAVWDMTSIGGTPESTYAPQPPSAAWDYDAYAVRGQVQGATPWMIEHRIVRRDGRVICTVARIGKRLIPCWLEGPR